MSFRPPDVVLFGTHKPVVACRYSTSSQEEYEPVFLYEFPIQRLKRKICNT